MQAAGNIFACFDFDGQVRITVYNFYILSFWLVPFKMYLQMAHTIYEQACFEKEFLKKKQEEEWRKWFKIICFFEE